MIFNNSLNLMLLNNKGYFIYLSNKKKQYIFSINKVFIFFNISYFYFWNILENFKKLNYFFFSWNFFIVKKIKFRHKIMWFNFTRKYFQIIKFNFGFFHYNYFLSNLCFFKRKRKYLTYNIFLLFNISSFTIHLITEFILNLQKINQYTLRGFRFSRMKLYKRVGKVSKYTMLKSVLF